MKRIYLYLFIFLISSAVLAFGYLFFAPKKYISSEQNTQQTTQNTESDNQQESSVESKIPSSYLLNVPFISQAPFGVWDDLHNNACEEASIILVNYYKKKRPLSKAEMDTEIKEMVDYEIKKYGEHKDLTAQEVADLAKEFYYYKNVRVVYNFSWDDLKKEIVKGNPVIVPAAGRLLGNPNFRQPGPVYHMFVIKGYTPKELITNDVGTRKGDGYRYSYSTLDQAIHDWTGSPESINRGKRAMIVISSE